MHSEPTSTSYEIGEWFRAILLLVLLLLGGTVARSQSTVVKGKVYWDSPKGKANIQQARVQILDPKSPSGKRVWRSTTADVAAEYEIDGVPEGKYDIAACDDNLRYMPRSSEVEVRQGHSVDVSLTPRDKAPALQLSVPKLNVVYLKDIETGCEFGVKRSDAHGIVLIPNTTDESSLYSRYVLCVDDMEEGDSPSPFESCVRKELPLGLPENEVRARFGKPDRTVKQGDRQRIFVYKEAKVTLAGGKVSDVKVELEPTNCLLGCPGK